MSQKFQATVNHQNEVSYVKLAGVIDEDNELADLVDRTDSYFAFLSNQRKVAEPDKVAMKLAGNGGGDKSKIRSRASGSPSMAAKQSSLPSVPSLPSISRSTGSGAGSKPGTGPGGT